MGLLSGSDFIYALRFLRLLTMPWEKTDAFKQGIIDKDGNKLKKPETSNEKSAYNTFHKLVFNIRRLLGKLPLGKSTIARYGAALYLIKEHCDISNKKLAKVISEITDMEIEGTYLVESSDWFLTEDKSIRSGTYILTKDLPLRNGELLAKTNTTVMVEEHESIGEVFGIKVFKGYHVKTKQSIYITQDDITF
mgnify:CR=1 FL=1|jgi:hypothetical protein